MGSGRIFPDYDEDEGESSKKLYSCKRCGARRLHWEDTGEGWVLLTERNEVHVCPSAKATDFEVIA